MKINVDPLEYGSGNVTMYILYKTEAMCYNHYDIDFISDIFMKLKK